MKKTERKKTIKVNPSKTALLLIDVISDFEFADGEKLFKNALPMAKKLSKLKQNASQAGLPVIYVNDNYGKWQEDFKEQVKDFSKKSVRGSAIVKLLAPGKVDFYVLKPRHSAFYKTVLDVLLTKLHIEKLILTGVTTDICIQFTAIDAYMREKKIIIPEDCVAAVNQAENQIALDYMKRVLDAEIVQSEDFDFAVEEKKI